MTKRLNRLRQRVRYHPSSRRNAFKKRVAKQRGAAWFEERYNMPATGSRLNAILYEKFINDKDNPCPQGVNLVVYNRQKLFEELTGQTTRGKMENSGNLFNDHIRRGVIGEPIMDKLYQVWSKGRKPLEMPSILDKVTGFIRVSADGQDPVTGDAIEYKMPIFVKDYKCAQPFMKKVWTCGYDPLASVKPENCCWGYHERHGCSYKEVKTICGSVDKCEECLRQCCIEYWHQCQAESYSLDAPGTNFIQLYSYEAIQELLGIKFGDDGTKSKTKKNIIEINWTKYKEAVEEFCNRPWCSMRFPKGKTIDDYIKVLYIPRDYEWFKQNIYEIWSFQKSVLEKRKELNMDFITYAKLNNIKLDEE